MDWAQVLAIVIPVMLAVFIGIIYNNRRVDDLRSDVNQRFAEMNETMNQRFSDMNQRISDLKSDISEIRHLLIDMVARDYDI